MPRQTKDPSSKTAAEVHVSAINKMTGRLYEEYCLLEFNRANRYVTPLTKLTAKQKASINVKFTFSAIQKRLSDYYQEARPRSYALTEFLASQALHRYEGEFSPIQNLSFLSLDTIRQDFEYPDGSWDYVLWAYRLPAGDVQRSADYWIERWSDFELRLTNKEDEVKICVLMLNTLYGYAENQGSGSEVVEELTDW